MHTIVRSGLLVGSVLGPAPHGNVGDRLHPSEEVLGPQNLLVAPLYPVEDERRMMTHGRNTNDCEGRFHGPRLEVVCVISAHILLARAQSYGHI